MAATGAIVAFKQRKKEKRKNKEKNFLKQTEIWIKKYQFTYCLVSSCLIGYKAG